jgi:hypothetical protein
LYRYPCMIPYEGLLSTTIFPLEYDVPDRSLSIGPYV